MTGLLARTTLVLNLLVSTATPAAEAFNPSPHAIDIPAWFQETFLDFREDVRDAAKGGKRLMIYFGQDGCPYCRELMRANFAQKDIVERMRRHFNAVALNIWGDREVTWIDGGAMSEKTFAAFLKVQYTPTLLFLDEKGAVALRLNGYYPPHKLRVALDYVAGKEERKTSFATYLQRHAREPASGRLHEQPFLMKGPLDLDRTRRPGKRPLVVLFEQKDCAACDELHQKGTRAEGRLHTHARVLRCARLGSVARRGLPAALPPGFLARLRRQRRLPRRAQLPALHPGAGGKDPRGRWSRRSLVARG